MRSDERPGAPGWYPDADGRMQRWDGSRWTGERRDLPPWAGAVGAQPGRPSRGGVPRHWIIFGAVVAFLFVAVSFKALNSTADLPPRTVHDADFVSAANSECRAGLQPMKDARPRAGTPEGRDPGSDEEVAATVDEAANRIDSLASELRDLAAESPDEAALAGWLDEWDHYADIGYRYADAVRAGSADQRDLAADGEQSRHRADLFAQANGLRDCTFA